ncbi:hypothetical protein CPB84DRAFT_1815148 [Gymnopilus junonius]|uniref:holo-[acyl-carrier-protein] synthase n=1 Tax=Gymnopilus junonius TaxID=109634 RepID=A0A9P5TPE8_GYMJU|nr:hypothetical protein CPB84DRAFT_1815148 [Gymnopilus junonius]
MQVWAVIYNQSLFKDQLYERALSSVDPDSQARIKKFYHRVDACRTLIGRLLVRSMLRKRGVALDTVEFAATSAGKPYITSQGIDDPIAYNITHDNNLVAMAFAQGVQNPPAYSLGIDIMKIKIPGRETLSSFIDVVGDQLTELEHGLLKPGIRDTERLQRFYWMWTLKEAYTKALGLGLGFDFKRVEFDVVSRIVRVDGKIPEGWKFNMFALSDNGDLYQGVVAEFVGGVTTEVVDENHLPDWLTVYDAVPFVEDTLSVLEL